MTFNAAKEVITENLHVAIDRLDSALTDLKQWETPLIGKYECELTMENNLHSLKIILEKVSKHQNPELASIVPLNNNQYAVLLGNEQVAKYKSVALCAHHITKHGLPVKSRLAIAKMIVDEMRVAE